MERNPPFEWERGLIPVPFPHTALLCTKQQFVKSSKPMKNATSLLFEERIIVTSSESENDVCYFENRNICALAACFKGKVVLLTKVLTYWEELLQEYSWSVYPCAGLSVHASAPEEHHLAPACWRPLVKGCAVNGCVASSAVKMPRCWAALFGEWQVCEMYVWGKQQQLALVTQRKWC